MVHTLAERAPNVTFDDDSDDGSDRSDDADDEVGSLVDVVDDDDGDGSNADDAPSDAESEPPCDANEAMRRDLDGISEANILPTGRKRVRRSTQFYETAVFGSAEYKRMMLCDVPDDELDAAVGGGQSSDSGSDGEAVSEDDDDERR